MRQKTERTGRDALEFDGELIVTAETERIDLGGDSARYRLLVFRLTDGGFVASIQYSRSGQYERRVTLSEVLETNHDVENFFFVFEPEEHCSKEELTGNSDLDQDGQLRKLYGYYNEQVQRVVAELQSNAGSPAADSSPTHIVGLSDPSPANRVG